MYWSRLVCEWARVWRLWMVCWCCTMYVFGVRHFLHIKFYGTHTAYTIHMYRVYLLHMAYREREGEGEDDRVSEWVREKKRSTYGKQLILKCVLSFFFLLLLFTLSTFCIFYTRRHIFIHPFSFCFVRLRPLNIIVCCVPRVCLLFFFVHIAGRRYRIWVWWRWRVIVRFFCSIE